MSLIFLSGLVMEVKSTKTSKHVKSNKVSVCVINVLNYENFYSFSFFLQSLIFWAKSFLPFKGQTELETRRVFVFNFPLFFSPRTVSLSSYPSIHLALPSKSKSCVTIATAAVCENYLNPSLFSFLLMPCVPSNIRWMLV